MYNITSNDIKMLRDYLDKAEALKNEEPVKLTSEEWDEAFLEINKTGKIPDKYKNRIIETETIVYDAIIDGKHTEVPEGIKQKSYYDAKHEEWLQKWNDLEDECHDPLTKLLANSIENGTINEKTLLEILQDTLAIPASQRQDLPALGSIPNGDSLNWLYRVLNSKGGRLVEESKRNRHEAITIVKKGDSFSFTRENKQTGSTLRVEIAQADTFLSKKNSTFEKVLMFTLQKMTAQNFPLEVGFSLQELVDLGMYSHINNARRAIKDFYKQQKQTELSGTVKKGRKVITEEGGVLFYHYRITNGYVTLSVNENFNMQFIANYFTVFPRFAYALKTNAFSLVRYIFFLARQNAKAIKEKGTFSISLEAIRENLGLPSVDDVKNRQYKQLIMDPIEKAIEEIENALETVPEAKEYGFTITPHGTDTTNIKEWLEGYLEIGLRGDFAETFVRIATKAEQDREKWERVKQAELAKIAARKEAKEK